jgi:multiple sugar transport system permease protein
MSLRFFSLHFFANVVTVLLGLLFAFPLYWAVSNALKEPREMFRIPPLWYPPHPRFYNFLEVNELVPFFVFMQNTAVLTVLRTVGGVFSASLVAYGFTFFRFRGRNILFFILIGTMMLPAEVTLVPTYVMFSKVGWVDSMKPLVVPLWFGGGAFSIFLFRQFFASIPRELNEAAKVDGCSSFHFYWSILVPLSKPAFITLSILFFQWSWNDLMEPLIYLNSIEKQTVSVGLLSLRSAASGAVALKLGKPTEHLLMAAAVMAMMPSVIVFFTLQRYFIRGVIMSGIKG